jgi:hypothetical protein
MTGSSSALHAGAAGSLFTISTLALSLRVQGSRGTASPQDAAATARRRARAVRVIPALLQDPSGGSAEDDP